ncbi:MULTISPECIES: hypothetical protein [Variovorax]|uniref:hypothetical protein n=2 Tax=Comamonadaceae TaxID=80864 RepID=UPI00086C5FC8|nr:MULTISPECIES: hypothetical protein [Variovorax]ODU14543.1 MAG: hypothetical protein ABS94_22160 [Variovorax sp. SCN 67-85]ODV26496.1 MAG: hypothetical protein ABT25_05970 [Variovorax sp. SCN 67-20]OJZ02461.1 MAG: hypothetical protein BGP22_16100 [Variovorax sp. 67-131]UKI10437.1 hypothetical protein L3V85_11500 [Variovorax paradoxus]
MPAVDTEKMRYRTIAVTRSVASGILVVASSVGLTGCADFYQQHRGFQDGWRTGEIVELGRANEIQRGGRTDCRKTASADQLAVQRFAILIDRSTGRRHAHVVMLDPATSLELGDIVSTNVIRCGTPIRVLSHAPALRS